MDTPRVRLMHHDPRWRQEFEQTRSSIFFSSDGWITAIEHIGSTAISGLIARPTIDVLAAAEDQAAIEKASPLIQGLNFGLETSPRWAGGALQLVKPRHATGQLNIADGWATEGSGAEPTHRIFLTVLDSKVWKRTLKVRDWLRKNAEAAIRFEEAKVARWRDAEGDLQQYQQDKAVFFAHLEERIDAQMNA